MAYLARLQRHPFAVSFVPSYSLLAFVLFAVGFSGLGEGQRHLSAKVFARHEDREQQAWYEANSTADDGPLLLPLSCHKSAKYQPTNRSKRREHKAKYCHHPCDEQFPKSSEHILVQVYFFPSFTQATSFS